MHASDLNSSYLGVLPSELLVDLTEFYLHKRAGEPPMGFTSEHPLRPFITYVSEKIRLHKFAPEYIQTSYVDWSNDQQRKMQAMKKSFNEMIDMQSKLQALAIEKKSLSAKERGQQPHFSPELQVRAEYLRKQIGKNIASRESCEELMGNSEFLESEKIQAWFESFFGGRVRYLCLPLIERTLEDYIFADDFRSPITRLQISELSDVQIIILKDFENDSLKAVISDYAIPKEANVERGAYVSLRNVTSSSEDKTVYNLLITKSNQVALLSLDGICAEGVEQLVNMINKAQKFSGG